MRLKDLDDHSPIHRAFKQLGGLTPTARAISKVSGVYVTATTAQSWLRRDRVPLKYLYALTKVTDVTADEFLEYAALHSEDDE